VRYKCGNCTDYDLCEQCESLTDDTATNNNIHMDDHVFIKVKTPTNFSVQRSLLPNFYRNINNTSNTSNNNIPITYSISSASDNNNNKGISEKVPATTPQKDSEKILLASFVADETIPDGTEMSPETPFVKSWRLRNDGLTAWPNDTKLIFVSGSPEIRLKSNEGVKVGAILPGQETVVSVDMTSPDRIGRFASYFRLVDGSNLDQFGHRVWVDIIVVRPQQPVVVPSVVEPVAPLIDLNTVIEEKKPSSSVEENNNNNNNNNANNSGNNANVNNSSPAIVNTPESPLPEFKSVDELTDALQKMEELGFTNKQRNVQVLYKHKGDVVQAVIELLDQQ
jgi:hypothetical protein